LSESQERMLMVLRPEKEAEARAVFDKWDLDFAVVGETIAEDRFIVRLRGEVKADLPLKALSGTAPEYDRPWVPTPAPLPLGTVPAVDPAEALLALIGSPNLCSRAWVWSQYDHMVMADTVVPPGSDAGVVRVHGSRKGIAFTSDVNPRYCRADPERGGAQAVAEAYRNLSATGARPLAATDNLNFGNPERPEIMGQLVGCIKGIAEACKALDMPIVSGNVSLYNETEGRAILPTPTIGGVGLIENVDRVIRMAPKDGDRLLLLGATRGHLGQSALLAEIFGREEGEAPPVRLADERRAGEFLRRANAAGLVSAAHDIADGGLAVAAAEMALAGGVGVEVAADDLLDPTRWFFGEDQARYLIACPPAAVADLMGRARDAMVPLRDVGWFAGREIGLGEARVALDTVAEAHASGLPRLLD
ncbi:MAG TPA: AIR synthase-related protein, partial [Amaricoccus sp.]|nr:AIR synthase-related protein [Amaricoccus sp.]